MNPHTVVVHCSATPDDMHTGWTAKQWRDLIDKWHKEKRWKMIGYHYVIARDGSVAEGRPLTEQGAHVKGHNKDTIGICLIGGKGSSADDKFDQHFTEAQRFGLAGLIYNLEVKLGRRLKIAGHNDYTNAKACPGFRVKEIEAELRGLGVRESISKIDSPREGWLLRLLKHLKGLRK